MLTSIKQTFDALEKKRIDLLEELADLTKEQLSYCPAPEKWSILMVLQHLSNADRAMAVSAVELAVNPVRKMLKPGGIYDTVLNILENDVPVEVPDKNMEPNGAVSKKTLLQQWESERKKLRLLLSQVTEENVSECVFSHPAAGPLDARRALRLAVVHFDYHIRQIRRIKDQLASA